MRTISGQERPGDAILTERIAARHGRRWRNHPLDAAVGGRADKAPNSHRKPPARTRRGFPWRQRRTSPMPSDPRARTSTVVSPSATLKTAPASQCPGTSPLRCNRLRGRPSQQITNWLRTSTRLVPGGSGQARRAASIHHPPLAQTAELPHRRFQARRLQRHLPVPPEPGRRRSAS